MACRKTRWLRIGVLAFLTAALLHGMGYAQDADREQVDLEIIEIEPAVIPKDFLVRARVTSLKPAQPTRIRWRYGGEGVGGNPVRGMFVRAGLPQGPALGKDTPAPPKNPEVLAIGEWSKAEPMSTLRARGGRRLVLTITVGTNGKRVSLSPLRFEGYTTNVEIEFEFLYKGKVVKTVKDSTKDGNVLGVVIPLHLLRGDVKPDSPDFLRELTGLIEYENVRRAPLESQPWAASPRPKRFCVIGNINGYRPFSYHGTRYSSRELVLEMCKTLRLLGCNGLRSAPGFLEDMIARREGLAAEFNRCSLVHGMGYPVPRKQKARGRTRVPEGAGCPYDPGVAERTKSGVESSLRHALEVPVGEVWSLTVDEIGTVIDRSKEGKGHLSACPLCGEGFGEYLAGLGLKPEDFGRRDWSEVKPQHVWDRKSTRPWLKDQGIALMAYYTRRFNCYVSAKMFTPLMKAFDAANERKRDAAAGSAEAKQPFIYSFALRGCTFLYGGHSLDFFNFYLHADNGFVYETSNRDPRIWSWDSYLCDVGRVVAPATGKRQGIYIKPHRGAPMQRMLAAVSRGVKMIYWYNFGPEYAKGDSFAANPSAMLLTARAAALLGQTEDVLYDAEWAVPAEVAIVSPRSSEIWKGLEPRDYGTAAFENAKWTYTALAHAHVPVDPIDEVMLANEDLSRYKAIYILGPNLRRDAAEKVRDYVAAGGTLYTSGHGLVRDEGNRPLDVLTPVLGLKRREPPEMWRRVRGYRATSLGSFDDKKAVLGEPPAEAEVVGQGVYASSFLPVVGREKLEPVPKAEVLAGYKDGGAAVTRHRFGKGQVYVVGVFAGLEYSARVRRPDFDMTQDFDEGIRAYVSAPALAAGVRPVVSASSPTVEGVLLKNPKTGKHAVTLANWAYRTTAKRKTTRMVRNQPRTSYRYVRSHAPLENVGIEVRCADTPRRVRSTMLEKDLPVRKKADGFEVDLPKLEEGDVLLF